MELHNDILIELAAISATVADIPKTNALSVPEGYFDLLSPSLLLNVLMPYKTQNLGPEQSVPQGYFDNLSASILTKIKDNPIESSINTELSQLILNGADKNPLALPQGYFGNLSSSILATIKLNEAIEPGTIVSAATLISELPFINVFEVPQGYFENLSTSISQKLTEAENYTDKSLPITFNEIGKHNPLSLPNGYFENLPDAIFKIIAGLKQHENNPTAKADFNLQNVKPINAYEAPQGYFENLAVTILQNIKIQEQSTHDEIKDLSAALHSVQYINTLQAPNGYFSNLSAELTRSIRGNQAKVVRLPFKNIFFKLAAAAIITGALISGIFKYINKQPVITNASVNLARVDKVLTIDSTILKGKNMDAQQFDEALKGLSKEEIDNYLEKNNSEEDMSALTANVDENSLPDKNDYLVDEKTLDNYLKELKLQN